MKKFNTDITDDQCKDTGMAMTLILLILGLYTHNLLYFKIMLPVLLINMITPSIFRLPAVYWLGFSHILGTIMSKVVLTVVFFLLVVPVGVVRRMAGKDTLQLKDFKTGRKSVMKSRNRKVCREDLVKPF
ncbi:SxtJ family membrane protein [Desulfobacterales bacterium HSG16]|nr:SxtJ family membrane protein [Desulfobacterales bacterium HSG16]